MRQRKLQTVFITANRLFVLCLLTSLVAAATNLWSTAQTIAQQPPNAGDSNPYNGDAEKKPEGPLAGRSSLVPEWKWRQVLMPIRVRGRFNTVEVHPKNPDMVWVGTEEGTILRTEDGGAVWQEIEPSPSAVQRRSTWGYVPELPKLGEVEKPLFSVFTDPPFFTPYDRVRIPFEHVAKLQLGGREYLLGRDSTERMFYKRYYNLDYWGRQEKKFVKDGFFPKEAEVSKDLLKQATTSRESWVNPIWSIAYCQDAVYPLLVLSQDEVYGSTDEGMTYVRLFKMPGTIHNRWIACDPNNTKHIAIATTFGVYTSYDGGVSFDPDLSGRPGRKATTLAWRKTNNPDHLRLIAAMGDTAYGGDPQSDEGLRFVYPNFDNAETAPWDDIIHIETTPAGHVWLATKDGIRASFDGGKNWKNIAPSLFGHHSMRRMHWGKNEQGGDRIVALHEFWVYATDDNGETWHPFFNGLTRRAFMYVTTSPYVEGKPQRWWILTRGGLWTNQYRERKTEQIDWETANWAKQMLRETPPFYKVLDAMLYNTYTHQTQIESMYDQLRTSFLVPQITTVSGFKTAHYVYSEDRSITGPYFGTGSLVGNYVFGYIFASWKLQDFGLDVFSKEEVGGYRLGIHDLNRQMRFIAEDVWHERTTILQRLAKGMTDELRIESLRFRVETLEAIIETWARRPLKTIR